jgi:hypothetical protein
VAFIDEQCQLIGSVSRTHGIDVLQRLRGHA